jgi:hypothetical protein
LRGKIRAPITLSSLEIAMTEEQSPNGVQAKQVNLVIALLVLLVAAAATHTWKSYQPQAQIKWEYNVGSVADAELNEMINKLGAEGWELVFSRRASVGEIDIMTNPKPEFRYEMIFRRPLPSSRPRL